MGYLHAKGILHKDLKSKNVFYDNGKVVITDFGLFSISGVLQAGRYVLSFIFVIFYLCLYFYPVHILSVILKSEILQSRVSNI